VVEAAPVTPAEEVFAPVPPPPPPPKIWSGGGEFGINGSAGNSDIFKLRLGANAKRETPDSIWKSDLLYAYANANNQQTENRAILESRYEWLFRSSPWNLWVSGQSWYDQFTAYDLRVATHTGVGYRFIKTDALLLKGRVGAGAAREFGGPQNRVVPELLAGYDFEWKISARQKFTSTGEIYPDLTDFGEYRALGKLAYELLVDPEWNLTLKLGALERYDSTPEGKKPNDLEYFGVLLWKF
jgi:putative salt-induced outer membrane protein YdiY